MLWIFSQKLCRWTPLQAAGHIPAQALQAYDKAIQIDPQNNPAWFFRGTATGILVRTTKANKAFSKSKVLRNGSDDTALGLFNQAFILKDRIASSCEPEDSSIRKDVVPISIFVYARKGELIDWLKNALYPSFLMKHLVILHVNLGPCIQAF